MAVPYTFGTATAAIPLSQLDSNFATAITLGNTAVYLGNTTASIGNLTLTNVTISSGEITTGNASVSGNVTLTGGTANGVAYLNGSKVLTTGSALVFDATNTALSVGGAALGTAANRTVFTLNGVSSNFLSFGIGGTRVAHLYSDANEFAIANAAGASGFITFQTNGSERARIDSSGRLLVGLTSSLNANGAVQAGGFADTRVVIDATSTQGIYFTKAGADNGTWRVTSGGNYEWYVKGAGTANMTLDTSGNLLVGTTSDVTNGGMKIFPNYDATGSTSFEIGHITGSSTGNRFGGFKYAGTLIGTITQNGTTGVLYNLTSDYRLKNDQQALTGAKDFIMALKPKKWQWWDGSGEGVGFVAHEFMEVAKYSGNGEKDAIDADGKPAYQAIQPSSSEVMANLVSFIQEQQALITQLQADVAALKGA